MSGFENRIAMLLQDAVPEPGHDIDVATVERLGRRRRATAIAAPVVAVIAVILAVVATITIAGRSDKPVQPGETIVTAREYGITVQYPQDWHEGLIDPVRSGTHSGTSSVADNPTRYLSNVRPTTVCEKMAPSGSICRTRVAHLGENDVYLGFTDFVPRSPDTIGPGLDTTLAGRRASIIERANVNQFCPAGTASTTDVVISEGGGSYLSILGCLGSSDTAKQLFQRLLDGVRFAP